ncbi:MAG: metal ABC transporter permease [Bacteroidia bacterium]|nr:metal ABC transporter permease [Bacteroidia bacterium]
MDAFWIILVGALVAACGAILGSFLLLRKMTMIGDAISHAVLPGIVLAYLVMQSRDSVFMLVGAAVFGILTTVLIEVLSKKARLQEDAAIGISFTWMFAIGVILISYFTGQIDLDQECVLYGEILYTPYDTWILGNGINMGPRNVWILGSLFLLILGFVFFSYKALLLTSFDPLFAAATGVSVAFWHYALMSLVSLTTVLSFESVGAILVIAFLVGPAATAYLITDSLPRMLALSVIFGITASILGYYLSVWINGSTAGSMTVAIGVQFLLALGYVKLFDRRRMKGKFNAVH